MGHSKTASVPSWLQCTSEPPPGPFTLTALSTQVETTAFKGKGAVNSIVAFFPVARKQDFLAGDTATLLPCA